MGCGTGEDILWWATLETRDDPPEPYNYRCYAVDLDGSRLDNIPDLSNIVKLQKDFTKPDIIPTNVDLMWSHDSLNYSTNPLETLKNWNEMMTTDGMLVLSVQQHSGVVYNRYQNRTHSGCYFHFTPTQLIYMLAVNGFDCRDAYMLKRNNDPWIHMAVYKSQQKPRDPATTTWTDLLDTDLLHPSVVNSITRHGCLLQEEIVMPWLDKENYFVDWVQQRTEYPAELANITSTIVGTPSRTVKSEETTLEQNKPAVKSTEIAEPRGIMRPIKTPKGRYVK